jgi:hypothetical protein
MNIRALHYKRSAELTVTGRDAKLWLKDVYIKATVVSLTTSGPTAQVAWHTLQLVSLVVTRTGLGSLLGK